MYLHVQSLRFAAAATSYATHNEDDRLAVTWNNMHIFSSLQRMPDPNLETAKATRTQQKVQASPVNFSDALRKLILHQGQQVSFVNHTAIWCHLTAVQVDVLCAVLSGSLTTHGAGTVWQLQQMGIASGRQSRSWCPTSSPMTSPNNKV